jgi:hypothetical protein
MFEVIAVVGVLQFEEERKLSNERKKEREKERTGFI